MNVQKCLPGHLAERVRVVELSIDIGTVFEDLKMLSLNGGEPFDSLGIPLVVFGGVRVGDQH